MRRFIRRVAPVAAVATVGALALAGCGSSGSSGLVQNVTVTAAYNSAVTSLWDGTGNQYSTYNANVQNFTQSSFNYYSLVNGKPTLVTNPKFGTYSVVSKSPLTIKLTINKGVTWSDGTQVNAADMLLNWASGLTKYNAAKGPVNFGAVGIYGGVGLDNLETPVISDGGRTVTITFKKPFVDWEIAIGTSGASGMAPGLPAHIVYELANPGFKGTAAQADAAVQNAILNNDTAVMSKLANTWQNAWNTSSMPTNPKLLVVDGPYVVSGFVKNQYITFSLRKNYVAGPNDPTVSKITVRFIPDPTAQVQALQNGEVQMIQGQPTTDTVAAVKKLSNVTVSQFGGMSFEHLDLTFNTKNGPFNPATYGGGAAGAAKALKVRQAFLLSVPRQQIVNDLIKPLNANAVIDNSALVIPGTPAYDQTVANNGSSFYAKQDITKAKQLLAQAGVAHPTVRFLYDSDNPRRVSEFQLIQPAAKQAGFNIVPIAKPAAVFFPMLGNGTYDATAYAWQFTSLAYTGNQPAWQTGLGENFQGYSNPKMDALWAQLAVSTGTTDQNNQLNTQIDKYTFDDAASLPLYQFPEMAAWANTVSGVSTNQIANGSNVIWNYWDWKFKGK